MVLIPFVNKIIRHSILLIGLLTALSGECQQRDQSGNTWLNKNPPAKSLLNNTVFKATGNRTIKTVKTTEPANGSTANRPATTGFIYPLKDCFTYTYRLKIGETGSNTFITGTTTTKNGETYTVGYAADGAGYTKGLIQQFDHTAGIGWTRSMSFVNRQVMLNSIRQLPNGNLVVIGSYQDAAPAGKQLLLAQFTEDGVLVWCKSLNYPGFEGIAVCSDPVNGIGFAGQSKQQMIYGRLDNAGNLVWLKQLSLMDYGNVVGMENDAFSFWYIACNGVQAGIHMGMLLSIDPVNGNLLWNNEYGGAATNQQFIFTDLALANLRPRIAGIFSTGNGAYTMCKATVNAGSQTESLQVFDVPSVVFDTTARVAIDATGKVLAFDANKNDPDIYVIKTVPDGGLDTMSDWAKKFIVAGNHRFLHAQRTFDAGMMVTTDLPVAAGTIQSQVLKTDSTGAITNCEGSGFTFYNSITLFYNNGTYLFNPINQSALLVVENPLVITGMLPAGYSCKSLTCPVQPPEDSCLTSFVRRYRSVGLCDLGNDLLPQHNEVIFTGIMRSDAVKTDGDEGILGRLDSRGKLLERKKIRLGNNTGFRRLVQLKDGNFIVLGSSSYNTGNSLVDTYFVTVSKFTPSLQLIWNHSIPALGVYSAVEDVVEDADGSLFLNYVAGSDIFCMKPGMIKLDNLGNLAWLKAYDVTGQCIITTAGRMTQDDKYLYVTNWTNGDASTLFTKIDKATGLPVLTRSLVMPDAYQWRGDASIATLGKNILMGGSISFLNGSSRNALVVVDENGVTIKSKFFSLFDNAIGVSTTVTRNQDIVLLGWGYGYSYFIRLDSNLNILYSRKIASLNVVDLGVKEDAAGAILSTGFFTYNDPYVVDLAYKKFSYDGKLGSCFSDSLLLDTESHSINQTPVTATVTTATTTLVTLPYSETSYSLQNATLLCAQVAECTNIRLQAPASLCDTLVHVATVIRNAGCSLPVSFTQSNANLKIVSSTDSTVSFKMGQSGSTLLVAAIYNGCRWLKDSVLINSTIGNTTFSLGSDTSICPNNSIVLRAGKNYFSYKWNDGSTADTLKITGPGTYFVSVTDACANVLADTIVIKSAPPVTISLGPDKIKCNDEQVLLTAPAGFISYSWGPAYNLIPVTDSQVNVFPLKDTSYFIKAEKTPGCFAFDTVAVKVNRSAAIQLGPDKSFCSGDSVVLDAGTSFSSYAWSTGAVSQKIVVYAKDIYTVSATNSLGCVSKDTLALNTYPNPVVQLGNDFSLCRGSSKTLDAGVFSSYLWNDLSTGRTLLVNNVGLYSVKVTDQNNCVGSDSIVVASILPIPANFLPADTLLCQYETIQLAATGNFSGYTWSTGSADKVIAAKAPGIYWLQVKDANNCMGSDTIAINLKECVAGFYVPTAFTPNNDGKNDLFKPLLMGNVIQYRFIIYNRYGEQVFESTDFTKGWNGKVNGLNQNTSGFTWVCWYQLEGSAAKKEKGSVMLLR